MALEKQLMTSARFEAFLAQPENAERRFELIDGEIVEMSPTVEHGILTMFVAAALQNYLSRHPIGRGMVEARFRPAGDALNERIPDLAVVLGRDKPIVRRGPADYMPDLAVEIKSPDDPLTKMREKANFYLANGTRLVWLVIPEKRLIEVYTLTHSDILIEGDVLTAGELLPGFALPVAAVFASVRGENE